MAMNEVIARLSVFLDLNTAAFQQSAGKASKRVKQSEREFQTFGDKMTALGKKMTVAFAAIGGAAIVGQLASLSKRAIDSTAEIGRLAQAAGVSASAFQELSFAASQVGISSDQAADGLKELNLKIGEAASGSKSAAAAFANYGVEIRDVNGDVRDAADILPDVADAFAKIKSPAEQAAFAAQLFGEDVGPRMVPLLAQGGQAIKQYREAAQELGIVLSDAAINKAAEAEKKMKALNLVLEAKIAGAISENADAIIELADALAQLIEYAGKAAKAWRYFANLDFSPGAPSFAKQIQQMQLGDLGPGVELTDSAAAAIRARDLGRFVPQAGGSLLAPRQAPANPWLQSVPSLLQPQRAVSPSAFGGTDWSQFTPGQGDGLIRLVQAANDLDTSLQGVSKVAADINVEVGAQMVKNFQMASQGALNLASSAQAIMDRLFPEDARRRQYIEDLAVLRQQYGGTADMAGKLAEAERLLRQEWINSLPAVDAMVAGLDRYNRATEEAAAKTEAANVRISNSYASMASNVGGLIAQLIGGKTGRIIGGIFSIFSQAAPLLGFANGTSFAPGGLALVGERGPELVDLPRGSRVTPNNDLPGRMGSTVEVIPSPYFDVVVDGHIARAGPAIAAAGARAGVAQVGYRQSRRWR